MTTPADIMIHPTTARVRLTVREELFLLAHDEERAFRPRIHLPALDIGLAGAVLIDLALAEHVRADHTRVSVTDPRAWASAPDTIAADATTILRHAGWTLPLPTALGHLTTRMYERTRGGLVAAGHLRETPGTWRRRTGYRLADPMLSVAVRGRARDAAVGRPGDGAAWVLCPLIRALNIGDCLYFAQGATDINAALDATTDQMRACERPALAAAPYIAAAVRGAVGDLATAVHR